MNLTLEQYERLNPRCEIVHKGVRMVFATPNQMTKWRADSIYEKEPCTLEWIDSFAADDVLFDIGANVGMYTIWAAATRGCRVFAFEPGSAELRAAQPEYPIQQFARPREGLLHRLVQ